MMSTTASLTGYFGLRELIFCALFLATVFYVKYLRRYKDYWKKQNVVHEEFDLSWAPISNMLKEPIHEIDMNRHRKYGKVFGAFEGLHPTLFLSDPDLIKLVLVKHFNDLPDRRTVTLNDPILDNMMTIVCAERWRKIRPAASPAFTAGKLRKMNIIIHDCARITAEHLMGLAEDGKDLNPKEFFGHYTLDVITRCVLGARLGSHTAQADEFVAKSQAAFALKPMPAVVLFCRYSGRHATMHRMTTLCLQFTSGRCFHSSQRCYGCASSALKHSSSLKFLPKCHRVTYFLFFFFNYYLNFSTRNIPFGAVCIQINKCHLCFPQKHQDFLQLMVDAQDSKMQVCAEGPQNAEEKLYNPGAEQAVERTASAKALTEEEALSQCVAFFIAGLDATSSALAFTFYLLALHPDVQQKLREEVDRCFEENGEEPSLDDVSKLKYLNCIISESLRMYPPAVRVERTACQDVTLGDTGINLSKGCAVVIPVYAMHHDPEYFPDPEKFDPERFSDENIGSIQPYSYLPFGAGPRNCIGMRFALQALRMCLFHVVRSVELLRTEKTKVPLKMVTTFSLLTAEDITIGVKNRNL
ncbi:cytochrome P450 3A31-like [Dermacentor silvarum]|uniref:cytochrome P450 3A31-like n=1 Tax=Dermacentor silvarum TaxID=543639 RepID=UPI002100C0C0|nr:cytochrome P450 3A31-like [Dermacentor silvarum]